MKTLVLLPILSFVLASEIGASRANLRHALGVRHRRNARQSFQKAPRFLQNNKKFFGQLADIAKGAISSLPMAAMGASPMAAMGASPMAAMGTSPMAAMGPSPMAAMGPMMGPQPLPMMGMGGAPTMGVPPNTVMPPPPSMQVPPEVFQDSAETLTADQEKAEKQLQEVEEEADKLELGVKTMRDTSGVKETKGIEVDRSVVNPNEVAEAEALEAAEKATKPKTPYTAPVIVLLPPVTTPQEKLEFARATACHAHMNPEMRKARNAKLAEMQVIKGKTEKELRDEIEETKNRYEKTKQEGEKIHAQLRAEETKAANGKNVKSDILFLKKDLADKDEEIRILIDKSKRLESRLQGLNIKVEKAEKEEDEEEKYEGGEEKEERRKGKGKRGKKEEEEEEEEEEE